MKKFLATAAAKLAFWLFKEYQRNSLKMAKIKAARTVLEAAEGARRGLRGVVCMIVAAGAAGAGLVLMVGGGVMAVLTAFVSLTAEPPPLYFWIFPLSIFGAGAICLVPMALYAFCGILSERQWMKMVESNRWLGPIVREGLESAEERRLGR